MADSKLADLTEDTSPTGDDLVYTVNDPAGTPADRKVKLKNLPLATFCGVRAKRTTAQTITTGSATKIDFDSEDYDTDGFHDTGSNTSRLTVPTGLGGKYAISGALEWASNTTGIRTVNIIKNNTTYLCKNADTSISGDMGMHVHAQAELAATDYVEIIVFHNRGSNLDVIVTSMQAWLAMYRVG